MFLILLFNIFYYFTSNHNLLTILFATDNIFTSYNTICSIYNLNYNLKFYDKSYINRYIYYLLMIIIKPFIHLLLYHKEHYIINYVLYLTTIPLIFNKKIYNSKAEYNDKDPYPTIKEDVEKIKKIIIKRQWNEFNNPYIIELITKIYEKKQSKNILPIIESLLKKIETSVAKLFTII